MIAAMKTEGALLWELNSPFKVDEIDLGDPVADEVQIRMHAAGMCHSDYHLTTGATPIGLPALGGHEGAGVVRGGIGTSAVQGAVISGAKTVIAIDPNEWKRDQAIKFGATPVYPSMAEAIGPMIDVTHGPMADKTIIAVGEMRGEYVEEAMTLTAKTGTCVVTGMGSIMDVDVKLNLFLFTMLQKTLKGNIFGGGSSPVETPRLVALQVGPADDRRDGDQHLLAGRHQRRLSGHARREEHPWRDHVRRGGLVSRFRSCRVRLWLGPALDPLQNAGRPALDHT
jgi:Zn-dependent alcohol dehydrogenase